jgi:hypothetical protein
MEKKPFFFVLALAVCVAIPMMDAFAQTPEKSLTEELGWMIGSWEGEGVAKGGSQFIGKLEVSAELDGAALLVSRESMNKEGGPSGGKKELWLIGFDGTTKKLIGTLYNNKSMIALYVGELKPNEVVFNIASPPPQAGSTNRITFRLLPDGGLTYFAEEGAPGKEASKVVEINLKKKQTQ